MPWLPVQLHIGHAGLQEQHSSPRFYSCSCTFPLPTLTTIPLRYPPNHAFTILLAPPHTTVPAPQCSLPIYPSFLLCSLKHPNLRPLVSTWYPIHPLLWTPKYLWLPKFPCWKLAFGFCLYTFFLLLALYLSCKNLFKQKTASDLILFFCFSVHIYCTSRLA